MKTNKPGLVISKYADSGECPMCVQTTEIFVSAFGAEAGNMALKTMATGGVYLEAAFQRRCSTRNGSKPYGGI